jgi:hypothetical protein
VSPTQRRRDPAGPRQVLFPVAQLVGPDPKVMGDLAQGTITRERLANRFGSELRREGPLLPNGLPPISKVKMGLPSKRDNFTPCPACLRGERPHNLNAESRTTARCHPTPPARTTRLTSP